MVPRSKATTFIDWLQTQTNRDDYVGDLARDSSVCYRMKCVVPNTLDRFIAHVLWHHDSMFEELRCAIVQAFLGLSAVFEELLDLTRAHLTPELW
jgi:hypothetical protein